MRSLLSSYPKPSIFLLMVFLLIFSFQSIYSQEIVREFPYSSEAYFSQLELHFERVQSKDKREGKIFLKDFEEKWLSGYYSDEMKEKIYKTSNLMIENRMRAIPFFINYFNTLNILIDQEYPLNTQFTWMKSCDLVLNKLKNSNYLIYLKNTESLILDQILFASKSIQWQAAGSWTLEVDTTIRYIFQDINLVCHTKRDSSNIYQTNGMFLPLTNEWLGNKGHIDWQRAGFDKGKVYANLNNYKIDIKQTGFVADSVSFFDLRYFETSLLGQLEEQIWAGKTGKKAYYPTFISYDKTLKIPEIFQDIDFEGGFKMQGARLIGVGNNQNPVVLRFKRKGKEFITLRSNSFSIETDRIQSQYASITIHYMQDSIYHSGLRMSYIDEKRELSLLRDNKGLSADPFFDTFHRLDIFVEAVYWRMDENVLDFDMIKGIEGTNKRMAFFQSNNRYSLQNYNEIQLYDKEHPLYLLNKFVDENMTNEVYIVDYARFIRMPYEQVKLQLLGLAHQGFVLYDAENDKVIVKDRTQFYLDARGKKVDYDVISFTSMPSKYAHAELKLDSFDLKINNLRAIILSDSQNLIIEPKEYIVVGKNRDFRFNGKVTAGRFSFIAKGCTFGYNAFKLDMPQIDSLWFWVDGDPLPEGGYKEENVQTALVNLSGDLLIDHPSNKSGIKPYNEYPIFNSKQDSYAYYDQPSIEKGVYTRDRFYFRISPFILNSLNDIKTEDIHFDGYLYSGGIFPNIIEPLTVMDDYSLGFTKATPELGLLTYGDKGIFYNTVSLSNKGLRGDGELDYLQSKTLASDYVFYLDSMNVYAESFNLQAKATAVEYPKVAAVEVYQHWMPYLDNMEIHSKEHFMSMYDDKETKMEGRLDLSPTGLQGKGNVHYKVAVMKSNHYDFKNNTYVSDTARFVDDGMILDNFRAEANYTDRKVLFTSNDGTSLVEFPDNLYVCYMDEATWFMDEDETSFSKKNATLPAELEGLSIREKVDYTYEGSEFISVHPNQDSLTFRSSMATFNTRRKVIKAQGVNTIRVADAAIFPGDGIVTILKGAEMQPLEDSKILANTTTKYHEIDKAVVKVKGRNDYSGKGSYVYLDMNEKEQNIYFENIRVDTTLQTIASGTILKEYDFTLSPAFKFYGDAHLLASRMTLEFEGGYQLKTGCIPGDHWVSFKSIVEPKHILLPVEKQPRVPDISKVRKYLGMANSPAKREVYSLFFEDKNDYYDSLLMSATGFLSYDVKSMEYRVSTEEKLLQLSRPDNYISLNSRTCATHAEGDIRFDIKTKDVKIKSYAIVNEKSGEAKMKVAMAFDFHFSDKALKEIVTVFKENTDDYRGYDLNSEFYQKVAGGYMGTELADKYLSKIVITGHQKRVPEQLQHTIFINEMDMEWQAGTNSYLSKGKINIGNFFKERINGEVVGYVELRKQKNKDDFTIYFEIGGEWFFFTYSTDLMRVLSSVDKFNEIIVEDVQGKGDKNELKEKSADGKKSKYRYHIVTERRKKDEFLSRIKPYI